MKARVGGGGGGKAILKTPSLIRIKICFMLPQICGPSFISGKVNQTSM